MDAMTWEAKTAKGNTYIHIAYSDPFPGRKGSDRVQEECGSCSGTGVYQGPSGHQFYTPATGGVNTGCFKCQGRGYHSVLVSSLRGRAKRLAQRLNAQAAADADYAAEAPAREAAELLAAWDAALAEQARRDAKAKGYLGEVKERLRNVDATVAMVRSYESQNYVTGAPETKVIIKFDVQGKVAVWFTGWTTLEAGQHVSLTGTIKKLDTRDGEDQTVLTRCIIK